jgi:hypothetical protein
VIQLLPAAVVEMTDPWISKPFDFLVLRVLNYFMFRDTGSDFAKLLFTVLK